MLNQTDASGSIAGETGRFAGEVNDLQQALRSDGYAIVRQVLSREEVKFLRTAVRRHLQTADCYNFGGKFQLQPRAGVPEIERIIASDAVRRLLAKATEPQGFKLSDMCDLAVNTTSLWHKDTSHFTIEVDGHAFVDKDFRRYKVAFYLQDQDKTSRATLKVRPGSHLSPDLTELPTEKVAVDAGDMIIFDVRIDHLGQLATLTDRLLRRSLTIAGARFGIDVQKAFTRLRSAVRWISPGAIDRLAIFMTFEPWGTEASDEVSPNSGLAGQMPYSAPITPFPAPGRGIKA